VAWDTLLPKAIKGFWVIYRRSSIDPVYQDMLTWSDLVDRPQDTNEAELWLKNVMDQHEGRLKELLAQHEAKTASAAAEQADRAALDCSKEFERHLRQQSARHRELLRTLDMLQKLRKAEFGIASGEEQNPKSRCELADYEPQIEDNEVPMVEGEITAVDAEIALEEANGRENDDDTGNVAEPTEQPCREACDGEKLAHGTMPRKAQNARSDHDHHQG
jgi:hypothetical protein